MLAQDWLHGTIKESPWDGYIRRFLQLPDKFNPHSSIAILNRLAERIVFTDDVPSLLYEMAENKQLTFRGVYSSARLPYDCFWLEYNTVVGFVNEDDERDPLDHVKIGALIQRISNDRVRMCIIIGMAYKIERMVISTVSHVVEFDEWPMKPGAAMLIKYAFNDADLRGFNREALKDIGAIISELIFGIFLVTQPRVYSDEVIRWKPSHNAKRAKSNKPPLLEYRKIKLHIVTPRKHYERMQRPAIDVRANELDTESAAAIQHRRYHKVMGHFRHYNRHDPPYTVWIEPHYRGDPKLGVTFTERDVTR